jgi:XTP/dITP diphosphohydrolase
MTLARAALPACLVLATGNAGKLREMRAILQPWQVDVRSQAEFTADAAAETAVTFVENALLKARFAATHAGLPAVADDSGLEVDALNGAPGVRSARFAGRNADDAANNRELLRALDHVPDAARAARYRCVMVYLRSPVDPAPVIAQAHWEGRIARAPRGDAGFGYDPLFVIDAAGTTAAQLAAAEKNRLSHRGRALRALVAALTAGVEPTA